MAARIRKAKRERVRCVAARGLAAGYHVRCAYRLNYLPDYWNDYVGFRLVSPGS